MRSIHLTALALAATACSSDPTPSTPILIPVPTEVLESADIAVVESELRASFIDGGVAIELPITHRSSGTLDGRIEARIVDVAEVTDGMGASQIAEVHQSAPRATHRLFFAGEIPDRRAVAAADRVIVWRVTVGETVLHGRTSLYAALGPIEVEIRGATDIPRGGAVPYRIILRDPTTLAPIAGAHITGRVDDVQAPAFEGLSDDTGGLTAAVALPADVDAATLRIEVVAPSGSTSVSTPLRVLSTEAIALSTDKTIYKPGQTIHVRALALSGPDKAPVAQRDALIELLDGRHNKVAKHRLQTDAFGVVAVEIPTAAEVNEGDWTIHAEIAGVTRDLVVPVVRYALPKMRVEVRADRGFAQPGQSVSGTIDARYLFGEAVTQAQLSVQAIAGPYGVVAAQAMTTDAQGHASYTLTVPSWITGDALEDGHLVLAVEATVTDGAGQTEHGGAAIPLASAPLVVQAVHETAALVPGVDNRMWIILRDPAGRPIAGNVEVLFPGAQQRATTGADGVAEFVFVPPANERSVTITVRAADGAARTVERQIVRSVGASSAVVVRADKARYAAGEVAHLAIQATPGTQRAYLDVYRSGAGVLSAPLALDAAGRATLDLPITRELRGLLVVDAFALGRAGEVSRGGARLLVDPEDHLDIQLEPAAASYAPGAQATVRVRVRDRAGAPQVAALGVTAVDEAVFALGGEPALDLHGTFSLDARALPAGASASALLGGDETAVRLALAGGALAAVGLEHNSYREELPSVRRAVERRADVDLAVFIEGLGSRLIGTEVGDAATADAVIADAGRLVDPFGRAYLASRGSGIDTVRLTSRGADERLDTADDASVEQSFMAKRRANVPEQTWSSDASFGSADGGAAPPSPAPEDPGSAAGAAVRADFRETIYVNPTLITDARGEATIELPLADSITTWRVSADGSTQGGLLGSARTSFRTFQDFFVDFEAPPTLSRGDEVELPAIVYNYLDRATTVVVRLDAAPWMDIVSAAEQSVTLGPSEVRAVHFRIRANAAGTQQLTVHGEAGALRDALVRSVRVAPGGTKEEQTFSDRLSGTRAHTITIPPDSIAGGTRVVVALTPGFVGEAVTGLDGLLQEPNGCFEQTTSSAWPNTLIARYLVATGQPDPELLSRARALVATGYQRLLTFESPTGGFNWWGDNDPGNRILSAIMLWHLADMDGIVETDPAVRTRTLDWLLAQQRADGAWPSGDALHAGNEVLGTSEVRTTAFIAWALAHAGGADAAVTRASSYLATRLPGADDLYATALVANALAMGAPDAPSTARALAALDDAKVEDDDGRLMWPTTAPSWTGARGSAASLETTGLAAYGLIRSGAYPASAAAAIRFVVANKDAVGSWYNTQATMNALRALLAAATSGTAEVDGTVEVVVNGEARPPIVITPADADLSREIDLTALMRGGDNTVELRMSGRGTPGYRLSRRVHRASVPVPPASELGLTVAYETTELTVGQPQRVTVGATYRGEGQRDQVIVRVGLAPGMAPMDADLSDLVRRGAASRVERGASDLTLYLMGVMGGEARDLSFRVVPSLPGAVTAPTSRAYVYYEPSIAAEAPAVGLSVGR